MNELRNALIASGIAVVGLFATSHRDVNAQSLSSATCPTDNTMVLVSGGRTLIGSTEADIKYYGDLCLARDVGCSSSYFTDELPQHSVTVGPFCIDRFEVTKRRFSEFVGRTGYVTTAEHRGDSQVWDPDRGFVTQEGVNWRNATGPFDPTGERNDHPVVHVSLSDAEDFCKEQGGRLPNENEWEKAARGDRGQRYPWGDIWNPAAVNYSLIEPGDTRPVGYFSEGVSPYGALDMLGNVTEWVEPITLDNRRGGGFATDPAYIHPSWHPPAADPENTRNTVGFRCAKDISILFVPYSGNRALPNLNLSSYK